MAIFAKAIIVGGADAPPTPTPKITKTETTSWKNHRENIIPVVEDKPVESKYVKKEHGELVTHINSKSLYLRDMIQTDSE